MFMARPPQPVTLNPSLPPNPQHVWGEVVPLHPDQPAGQLHLKPLVQTRASMLAAVYSCSCRYLGRSKLGRKECKHHVASHSTNKCPWHTPRAGSHLNEVHVPRSPTALRCPRTGARCTSPTRPRCTRARRSPPRAPSTATTSPATAPGGDGSWPTGACLPWRPWARPTASRRAARRRCANLECRRQLVLHSSVWL